MSLADSFKLKGMLNGTHMELSSFLHRAVALTKLVQSAHKRNTIIGNLSLACVRFQSDLLQAVLTENRKMDYAYLSPEQLGRINRAPDERSDLYALGIIFYEMLAGQLPFQAQSAEEWIHVHMAVLPKPIREQRPELDGPLDEMLLKLLSKSPEERYQSAYGLLADLQRCVLSLNEAGELHPFEIASSDKASRFRLPRMLFGREQEVGALQDAFELACVGASAFVLVTGHAGSGKTALISELKMPIRREGGQFITGKCDLMNREIPFSPILQALRRLLRQVWSESPERIAQLRLQMVEALGSGAGVITEFLPEAAKLLGASPSVEPLPPAEAAVRFRRLLPIFIKIFAGREHPLVLFLDDLQWADPDTLDVLQVLANDGALHGLLVIAAFRLETTQGRMDNEDEDDAAALWVQQMLSRQLADRALRVQHIKLTSLSYVDVRRFLSHILNENTARVRQLAESLYHRTGGNPLYLHQFLDSLYREHKLLFDEEQAMWTWDMAAVTEQPEDPDILHFIERRIRMLPERTISLLGIAAALGSHFHLATVALVSGYSFLDTLDFLQGAEDEGLISREDGFVEGETEDIEYAFLHDRVQQAAYQTVSEAEHASLHLAIGRMMHQSGSENEQVYSIFDKVYHLNLGSKIMTDPAMRIELAEFNLQAGLKSKATTAYAAALYFLETGLYLIGENDAVPGSLAYQLMLELPECEYMCGYTERASILLERLMARTTDLVERSRIYLIRISMYTFLAKDELAVNVGRQALAEFGWKLPVKYSKAGILKEVAMTQTALYRMRQELPYLPLNNDPHYKALSDLVMAIATSVFTLSLELSAILFSRFVRFGLKHGNNEAFAYILASYGLVILRNKISFTRLGLHYIDTAFLLASSFESTDLYCRLYYIRGLSRLQQNPKEGLEHFEQSIHYGMESANLTFVSIAMLTCTTTHTGNLYALSARIAEYEARSQKLVDEVTLNIFRIARRYVAQLQGEVPDNDEVVIPLLSNRSKGTLNNEIYYNCTCQIEIAYLAGRYREALEWTEQGEFNTFRQTRMQVRKQHVYQSLSLAALYAEAPQEERKSIRKRLGKQLRSMQQWSGYFGQGSSAYLLIMAELERIDGQWAGAAKGYELAINSARTEGYGMMEAMAYELASRFYKEAGSVGGAEILMADACNAYAQWGATVKVEQLKKDYPGLPLSTSELKEERKVAEGALEAKPTQVHPDRVAFVDDGKVFLGRISEWAGSADDQDMFTPFLTSALRYSGAVHGYVLNGQEEVFHIEAQSGSNEVLPGELGFAESIVRYVIMTGEPILLANASHSSYAADPSIQRNLSKSILCMPVLFPGSVLPSVLYLENNLIVGAFTKEGLEVLNFMITRMVYQKSLQESRIGMISDELTATTETSKLLVDPLTLRETEILYSLSDGLSNKEIADRFGITEGTVKSHVFRLYGKLGVKRRSQAISRARELQLVE
ncbi:AAA family ATPase [Paenibacillus sp. 19GGS1-52]|uniref:AAA family ATPase n=1 Tax=Paenibacillus sp. 19GGS1-52 TaxID=2758563 RepID=UPI001EFC270A|nr:AAA family ATPase [Paenibacillus sp. 19GGS1-52]ULO06831.1 AAA family ATPase [Paenibacillus sp. 19GGS1-52]